MQLVRPHIIEVLDAFVSDSIHLGFDEIRTQSEEKAGLVQHQLPGIAVLNHLLELEEWLSDKGIQIWIWGDMFLSQMEFPKMRRKFLHGNQLGYGKNLGQRIPKNINICDWHYFSVKSEYPSLRAFVDDGLSVYGFTWKSKSGLESFNRYASVNSASGMITTVWWYLQKEDWNEIERIIKISSSSFDRYASEAR